MKRVVDYCREAFEDREMDCGFEEIQGDCSPGVVAGRPECAVPRGSNSGAGIPSVLHFGQDGSGFRGRRPSRLLSVRVPSCHGALPGLPGLLGLGLMVALVVFHNSRCITKPVEAPQSFRQRGAASC
ncbi:hypothetical protein E2C01_021082 [Portunus trituberculatus]|uniref:Uncharacterized protein n=1 Tax=Portunus trituberculatus TaxID=210409 RepID=A0A5B7E3Q0_PORTR|nr:hypothetical protein [Portunus trituberculatus]